MARLSQGHLMNIVASEISEDSKQQNPQTVLLSFNQCATFLATVPGLVTSAIARAVSIAFSTAG